MMIKKLYKTTFSPKVRLKIKRIRLKSYSLLYIGNKYHCNICNKSARKFITHGHIPRNNARCPHCLSLERTRVLWFYLNNEIFSNHKHLKILHFAPEHEIEKRIRKKQDVVYYTADINPDAAQLVIDITDIPFKDNCFDLIICSHVLVEVPDEKKALNELKRVIKQDGKVLIITQIFYGQKTDESLLHLSEKERFNKFGANLCRIHGDDFTQTLKDAGFYVDKIDYRTLLGKEIIKKYALGKGDKETIFICSKIK